MKRLLLIYHPGAGRGKIRGALCDILDVFSRAGYRVTACPTLHAGDVGRLMQGCEAYDCVVLCGGDGTLHEGVNVYGAAGGPLPTLGYLPAGTTNDFAYSLRLPLQLKKAAQRVVAGETFYCDAGRFNDQNFAYIAAFGAFTEVAWSTPRQTKNALGHFAYVMEGIRQLPSIRGTEMTVTCDGEAFSGRFLYGMVSNTVSVGGFRGLAKQKHVQLDDGLLEVLFVREPENLVEQSELMTDLFTGNFNSRWIRFAHAARVEVSSSVPVSWTLDGEFGGICGHADIAVCPGLLPIYR